jgi:peptidoglycan/xylan/chitin deacetylase (PgdA/CDA1 family)
MTKLEDVLIPIIEEIPTYMRPPYFDVSPEVLATMAELGYKVITASIDTKDYEHDDEVGINISYEKFLTELDAGGSIVLAHDIHYWTGESLLERMLIEISERGLTGMASCPLSFSLSS